MSYGLALVTPPAAEPVTLTEAKSWLRVDSDDNTQDELIGELITAARNYCEKETGRAFCTQTWNLTLDRFPIGGTPAIWQQYSFGYWQQRIPQVALASQWWPDKASIRLPKPPCQVVESIKYIAANLVLTTLDPSLYLVDVHQELARITPSYGNIWPILTQQLAAVTVQFTAGYSADGASVPAEVKTAMRTWLTGAYEDRSGVTPATLAAVDRILDSVRTAEYT